MSNNIRNQVVVVTGGIGTGKSTVCSIFKEFGATIVSADNLARIAAIQSQSEIQREFPGVYDKELDRKKLAEIVFNNPSKRLKLESILHPKIQELADSEFSQALNNFSTLVIYECPLFYEVGMDKKDYKAVILITANQSECIDRVTKRDNLQIDSIKNRINAQMSLESKVDNADFVINNNGNIEDLKLEARKVYEKVSKL